jgi:hypothetical protein
MVSYRSEEESSALVDRRKSNVSFSIIQLLKKKIIRRQQTNKHTSNAQSHLRESVEIGGADFWTGGAGWGSSFATSCSDFIKDR